MQLGARSRSSTTTRTCRRSSSRSAAGSQALALLVQRLLEARRALEGGEPGRVSRFGAAASPHGEHGRGAPSTPPSRCGPRTRRAACALPPVRLRHVPEHQTALQLRARRTTTRCARRRSVRAQDQRLPKPSQANEAAFARAVDEVAAASQRLLDELVTAAAPKDREVEAARARARAATRYATG